MKFGSSLKLVIFVIGSVLLLACDRHSTKLPKQHSDAEGIMMLSQEISQQGSSVKLKRSVGQQAQYADIYNRNLFNPDRQFVEDEELPSVPEPTPAPARAQTEVPDLELVGTLKTDSSNENFAFIKNAGDPDPSMRNKIRRYSKGDWIGDYWVSQIETSEVTLIRGEDVAVLRLRPPENIGRPTGRAQQRRDAQRPGGARQRAAQQRAAQQRAAQQRATDQSTREGETRPQESRRTPFTQARQQPRESGAHSSHDLGRRRAMDEERRQDQQQRQQSVSGFSGRGPVDSDSSRFPCAR